jgi:hypothetical protein
MQFTDRFKRRFSLAEQANIGKKNISIFDLRLGAFTVDPGAVSPFDEITLAQRSAYKRKAARSNSRSLENSTIIFFIPCTSLPWSNCTKWNEK